VTGGAFARERAITGNLQKAAKKRKKLMKKFEEAPSDERKVKAMENAQASGSSSPFISTTTDKQFALKRAQEAKANPNLPDEYELITIKGPKSEFFDFEFEFEKLGGRKNPKRLKDVEQKELGITDLFIPKKGKSKSGFEIKDREVIK
jgi:hypothetical protein